MRASLFSSVIGILVPELSGLFSVVDIPADESKVEEVGAGEGETEILLFKAGGLEEGYKRVGVAGNTICRLVRGCWVC